MAKQSEETQNNHLAVRFKRNNLAPVCLIYIATPMSGLQLSLQKDQNGFQKEKKATFMPLYFSIWHQNVNTDNRVNHYISFINLDPDVIQYTFVLMPELTVVSIQIVYVCKSVK